MNREDEIQAALEADALWEKLPRQRLCEIVTRGPIKTRLTRGDVENTLQHLLRPAIRELRGGQRAVAPSIVLLQAAQRQLRQNAPPALVLDHVLLQLAKVRRQKVAS